MESVFRLQSLIDKNTKDLYDKIDTNTETLILR